MFQKEFVGFVLNVLGLIRPVVAYQIQSMPNSKLKNPSFMVIMAHWPQKRSLMLVCVCVSLMWVTHHV